MVEQNSSEPVEFASILVPSDAVPLTLIWEPVPYVELYFLCRLQVPVRPEQSGAFLAGALDLMMERFVLPSVVRALVERNPGATPHRLVVARVTGGRLLPVPSLAVAAHGQSGAVRLEDFGPPVKSWSAGLRVGTPPSWIEPQAGPFQSRAARALVEEPGGVSPTPPTFVERPVTVVEGRQLGTGRRPGPGRPLHRSPLEAWEKEVRPRQVAGGRLPDLRSASAVAPLPPEKSAGGEAEEPRAPVWAVIASPTLLRDSAAARAALRMLRGFLRVALVGLPDRPAMDRWADRAGVPLDGVFALPGDADTLPRALGCRADEMIVFTLPGEAASKGARQIEVEPDGFAEAAEQLCDEL